MGWNSTILKLKKKEKKKNFIRNLTHQPSTNEGINSGVNYSLNDWNKNGLLFIYTREQVLPHLRLNFRIKQHGI